MLKNAMLGAAALTAAALFSGHAQAGSTQLDCYNPQLAFNTGLDGTSQRLSIRCAGGLNYRGTSNVVSGIEYLSMRTNTPNALISANIMTQVVHGWVALNPSQPL